MDKRLHLPQPEKGDLGIIKNYRDIITLTFIAAKIYNALLLNYIQPEIEKSFRKNQNNFRRNRSTYQIRAISRIIEGIRTKNLEARPLFVDISKAFDSIHRGKME